MRAAVIERDSLLNLQLPEIGPNGSRIHPDALGDVVRRGIVTARADVLFDVVQNLFLGVHGVGLQDERSARSIIAREIAVFGSGRSIPTERINEEATTR